MHASVCCQRCICETSQTDVICSRCYILKCDTHPVFAPLTRLPVSPPAPCSRKATECENELNGPRLRGEAAGASPKEGEVLKASLCCGLTLTAAALWASSPSMPHHKEVRIRPVIVTQRRCCCEKLNIFGFSQIWEAAADAVNEMAGDCHFGWDQTPKNRRAFADTMDVDKWPSYWKVLKSSAEEENGYNRDDLWVILLQTKHKNRKKEVIDNVYNILCQNLYRES